MRTFYVFFCLFFMFRCDNRLQKTDNQKKNIELNCDNIAQKLIDKNEVVLTLTYIDDTKVLLCITNYLEEEIVVNEFIIGTAIFTLEIQDNNGNIEKTRRIPPPMPPDNLNSYDVILSSEKTISVLLNISNLENNNQKKMKIRAKINYRCAQSIQEMTKYSEWIFYKPK